MSQHILSDLACRQNIAKYRYSVFFRLFLCMVAAFCFFASVSSAWAQGARESNPRQTTESPYFFVPGGVEGVDELPLKSTDVDVRIAGVIADVTIVQHYSNEGTRPIEARYVFPGSTRAAVYAMNVHIGERVIEANIREKEQAREEYEAARDEGKTAALLEEHLPNVFQMNVANIMPGDHVRVELHYTELLVPQSGRYQFVFPAVVGPRYNSPNTNDPRSRAAAAATSIPYSHAGEEGGATLQINVKVISPVAVQEMASPSHPADVSYGSGRKEAEVHIERSALANNRDFILNYRLAADQVQSGLMLYESGDSGDENFFLAMVQPPQVINPQEMPARDYIFVVDISGSMGGFPLDTAKQVIKELLAGLRPNDTFNIMLFSGSSSMLSPESVSATPENVNKAMQMLSTYHGGGSTELIPALRHVYSLPNKPELSRTVVVVTDGYVSVEREAFDLVRQNLNQANVFAFGIGSSVNRFLIEGLARAGMGEPFVITQPDQAKEQARLFYQMIASPVLTNVSARFEGLDVYDVEPLHLPDVLGERPVIVYGKWRGSATGQVVIEGLNAHGLYRQELAVNGQVSGQTGALRYLWARSRIDSLMDQDTLTHGRLDQNSTLQEQITALGLKYSLLTPYTSFVAVDHAVRNTAQGTTTVTQPVPMPQGVSDMAIGNGSSVQAARRSRSVEQHVLQQPAPVPPPLAMLQPEHRLEIADSGQPLANDLTLAAQEPLVIGGTETTGSALPDSQNLNQVEDEPKEAGHSQVKMMLGAVAIACILGVLWKLFKKNPASTT